MWSIGAGAVGHGGGGWDRAVDLGAGGWDRAVDQGAGGWDRAVGQGCGGYKQGYLISLLPCCVTLVRLLILTHSFFSYFTLPL